MTSGPRTPAKGVAFRARDGRSGLVRVARARDARACLAITLEAARERPRTIGVSPNDIWTARKWREHRMDRGESGVSLVAELDGEVVGTLTVVRGPRPATRHAAEWGITVAASARGIGVGRALIAAVDDWAREFGVMRLAIGVFAGNARAHALYRSMGYIDEGTEHSGTNFPEGPVDVLRLYKILPVSPAANARGYDDPHTTDEG